MTPAAKCWMRLRTWCDGFQTAASTPPDTATAAGMAMIRKAFGDMVAA
jgi:hypothetical protein